MSLIRMAPALVLAIASLTPAIADAIPAFARRYETSCRTCHAHRYPRLNAYGRGFRDNGYQLPDGADEIARARRTLEPGTLLERIDIFKEVPLSIRGQVFGIASANPEPPEQAAFDTRLFSYISGGGSVARDVSFFFTWTPFPEPQLHQARIGLHNLADGWIGEGTLNVRAGALFLLDFSRPDHRAISPVAASATGVSVGANAFTLENPAFGVEVHGRPLRGPFSYELAVVSGDAGPEGGVTQPDRDGWKDVFGRLGWVLFQHSDHELSLGAFGYLGRSEFASVLDNVTLAQRDDFWFAGADVELDVGPVSFAALGYASRHSDPLPAGGSVMLGGVRAEVTLAIDDDWVAEVRYDEVLSGDLAALERRRVLGLVSWLAATDVALSAAARADLLDFEASTLVLTLDVVL